MCTTTAISPNVDVGCPDNRTYLATKDGPRGDPSYQALVCTVLPTVHFATGAGDGDRVGRPVVGSRVDEGGFDAIYQEWERHDQQRS